MDTSHFHPMVVHFPVALILTGFLFELINLFYKKEPCLSKTSLYLMIIGTLGAIFGYLTGEFFTPEFQGELSELKELHEISAKTVMFLMIAATCIRIWLIYKKNEESKLKWLVFILFTIAAIGVCYTGLTGGNIVYDNLIQFPK